jgi:hypothetical protein
MNHDFARTNVRRWVGLLGFSVALLVANCAASYGHEPYHAARSDRFWNEGNRREKLHQKMEKRALKEHQRQERFYYGNNPALRAHQRQERNELRYHQWNEKDRRRPYRGYYRDDSYYRDGFYRLPPYRSYYR